MNTARALCVVLASLIAAPVPARQHLVEKPEIQGRLAAAAEERAADRLEVDGFLASPAAAEAAAVLGADVRRLRARLDTLSDRELRDLAARAESLRADPAAGLGTKGLILIAVVVLLVVVIVAGIKDACRENPQDCNIN